MYYYEVLEIITWLAIKVSMIRTPAAFAETQSPDGESMRRMPAER